MCLKEKRGRRRRKRASIGVKEKGSKNGEKE